MAPQPLTQTSLISFPNFMTNPFQIHSARIPRNLVSRISDGSRETHRSFTGFIHGKAQPPRIPFRRSKEHSPTGWAAPRWQCYPPSSGRALLNVTVILTNPGARAQAIPTNMEASVVSIEPKRILTRIEQCAADAAELPTLQKGLSVTK
jgi:hypothetical protein